MITIRKLHSLPSKTGLRKSARLLQGFEVDIREGKTPDPVYIRDLFEYIKSSSELQAETSGRINTVIGKYSSNELSLLRACNKIRHILLTHMDESPGDWDLLEPADSPDKSETRRTILPLELYLDDIRSPFNVGSIFRTSESFGISKINISPGTASPLHRRAQRTAMGCTEIIPWEQKDLTTLEHKNIFALELNGTPIDQFEFPDNGIAIIGSEELGVSPECLNIADNSLGRVSIPITGLKGSINVSVAFGILMYSWYSSIAQKR